jgi:SAM-dependent methyltransferase
MKSQQTRPIALIEQLMARIDRRTVPGRLVNALVYRAERLLGHSDALTPPWHVRNQVGPFADPRHYRALGQGVLEYFIGHCNLRPSDDVLDLGCGCGQIAAPLSGYLDRAARYEGFDIGDEMIDWCRRHVAPRHPRFGFQALDVHNSYFRPGGRIRASELVFPYGDGAFDFAFAKSLFTHLLPADTASYVAQTARVLRPGGRAWFSFFFVDDEARAHLAAGQSTLAFEDSGAGYWTVDRKQPEHAVARAERDVLALLEQHGFVLAAPIERGSWCGRPAASYQDSLFVIRR